MIRQPQLWESDSVRWPMISRKRHLTRTENLGWNQRVVQDFLARDGIPRSKFIGNSRSKHWAVSPVSLASQPFLFPNLTLSSIQCMKNITIMNQNKHLFAHITCYFLDSTNVRIICFLQPNWLSLLVLIVLHLSWRTEDNQWKCHVSENDVSYSW